MAIKVTVANAVAGVVTSRPRIAVSVVAPQSVVDAVRLAAGASAGAAAAAIQYTLPATQIAYITLNSAAALDTSGQYRWVPDAVVTVDGARLAFGTTKRDAFALSDSSTFFFAKGLKETVSFLEVVTRTLLVIRSFNDSFSFADATQFVLSQKFLESLGTTDTTTMASAKVLRDAQALVDLAKKTSGKLLKDAPTVTDAQARTLAKKSVDSFGLTDAPSFALASRLADLLALVDTAKLTAAKALGDTFALSDKAALAPTKGLADTPTILDTQARTLAKKSVDSLALADLAKLGVQKLNVDSVGTADALTRTVARLLTDGFALNDLADVGDGLTVSFAAGVSNVAFATDTALRATTNKRTDSVGTTESGLLVNQSYCDLTYFADDYVGESRTFS